MTAAGTTGTPATGTTAGAAPGRPHDVATARPRLRPGRIIASAVLALIAVQLVAFGVGNERFQWDVVAEHLFDPSVLRGLGTTMLLAVLAMLIGSVLGGALAAAQLSDFGPTRWAATVYVGVFRGIPPLVQLIFWFNLAYLLPRISIGVPFGPTLLSWDANDLITPLTAGVIGLSLVQSAYMAEIIRAGILGVDHGQREAASAMGFTPAQTFFRIILPQAMRVIIPPSGSQFITVVKGTALVSVIAMNDLLHSVQVIYNQTYEIVPMLIVACLWYLTVVTLLTIGQRRLERRFARGHLRTTPSGGAS
ncbi:Amino acid ABC transporter permease protein [Pseudonocardia sp. Ae168_Ps1]|uniref:amino acid ABC transporter permease n=1 Tax=unclassified Pseudonocardia TaxID=2619320 RepID=UPI00094AFB01|nr:MULTISPECIES: amino acid ABC transporter permease [unclassified Pseudonocardia]OLL72326.1 Amino acid ABC transporter permease protein [Pseudonocardia sp. Ae150A_Ps1]OLL78298.1 Amino acid ABC transporter permease protein [Pseudonocardia sp. Ae168_Ps1]OLL87576.1 Amino acid ABC transporter permease protein [Pseudonocardia sp. Ae263_Ps1]OLL92394.1 Amino acid ABC transporter permease protein [Pseudonocardia sp. Ae356_Ps1]